jgi:cell division protein FtsB
MHPEPESRRRSIGGVLIAAVLIASVSYFTFASLQGEHGLFRLVQIEAQENRMRAELVDLKAERAQLANSTQRLSESGLDLDLLDERARKVLGLGREAEIIIR